MTDEGGEEGVEGGRYRETDIDRDRQTDRHTDTETGRDSKCNLFD